MAKTKVYRDGDTILLVTDDEKLKSEIAKLIPTEFEEYETMDLSPLPADPKEKDSAVRSNFSNGTYKGLKPADYVKKYGVEGALAMFTEKPIPEDMLGEVKRVCAQTIYEAVEKDITKDIDKDDFIKFVTLYNAFVGASVKRILTSQGYGTIENYCAATDLEIIREDYKGMCKSILMRAKKAL